jgi:hypothetical protein
VEIKAKEGGIAEEDIAQSINHLKCSVKVGLILNLENEVEIRRVIFKCH